MSSPTLRGNILWIITKDRIRPDSNSASKLHAVEKFLVPKRVKDAIFSRISRILPEIYRKLFKDSNISDKTN